MRKNRLLLDQMVLHVLGITHFSSNTYIVWFFRRRSYELACTTGRFIVSLTPWRRSRSPSTMNWSNLRLPCRPCDIVDAAEGWLSKVAQKHALEGDRAFVEALTRDGQGGTENQLLGEFSMPPGQSRLKASKKARSPSGACFSATFEN